MYTFEVLLYRAQNGPMFNKWIHKRLKIRKEIRLESAYIFSLEMSEAVGDDSFFLIIRWIKNILRLFLQCMIYWCEQGKNCLRIFDRNTNTVCLFYLYLKWMQLQVFLIWLTNNINFSNIFYPRYVDQHIMNYAMYRIVNYHILCWDTNWVKRFLTEMLPY